MENLPRARKSVLADEPHTMHVMGPASGPFARTEGIRSMGLGHLDNATSGMSARLIAFVSFVALVVGAAVHGALIRSPLDIVDFPEFIPLLEQAGSFTAGIASLAEYFGGHGRFNLVTQAYIGVVWLLVGENPVGWQAAAWVMMALFAGLLASLAHDLHSSTAGVIAAVGLTIIGSSGAAAWLRFTGEPLGAILFVCSLRIALRYRLGVSARLHAMLLALAWSSMVLAKETLVVLIPIGAVVALVPPSPFPNGVSSRPAARPILGALLVTGLIITVVWISVRTAQHPTAYAASFGEGSLSVTRFVWAALAIALPSRIDTNPPLTSLIFPANCLFLGVVFWAALRTRRNCPPTRMRHPMAIAIGCTLAGSLVYLPWSRFESFYGLPFAVGPLALFALCVSQLVEGRGASRILVGAMLGVIAAFAGALTWSRSNHASARRAVEYEASLAITAAPADTLFVARRYPAEVTPGMAWQLTAATFERHGRAVLGRSRPQVAVDIQCEQLTSVPHSPNAILVVYDRECGQVPSNAVRIGQDYVRLGLLDLVPERDTFSVAIHYPLTRQQTGDGKSPR